MRNTISVLLISSFIFTAGALEAADKDEGTVSYEKTDIADKNVSLKSKNTTETATAKIKLEDVSKREEESKKAKEELSKQEWSVYVISLIDKQAKVENDTLTFVGGKMASKELSAKGYLQSNCTITPQEDGTIVWETMQSNEKEDVVFWRGELKDGVMRGILSMHPKDEKNNQDFSFSTEPPVIPEVKIERKKVEEPQAQPAKVDQQKAEQPRKKSKK